VAESQQPGLVHYCVLARATYVVNSQSIGCLKEPFAIVSGPISFHLDLLFHLVSFHLKFIGITSIENVVKYEQIKV